MSFAGFVLAGCGNFGATEFQLSAPRTASQDINGIPVTLNKPQFTVVRTPGASGAPAKYQVTVAYVADSAHRYVLRMTPNWTASIDWTVSTDDSGSLSDTNGKATDQTVPILQSLATLAGALAAADTYKEPEDKQLGEIDQALAENWRGARLIFNEAARRCAPATRSVMAEQESRWHGLRPQLAILATENRMDSFAYSDVGDRILLETALCVASPTGTNVDAVLAHAPASESADLKPVAEQLKHLLFKYDLAALNSMKDDAVKQQDHLYSQFSNNPQTSLADNLHENGDELKMVQAAISELTVPPRELLLHLTGLTETQWQARRLVDLNKRISDREFSDRASGRVGSESLDPVLREMRLEKAALLGLQAEYNQLLRLREVPVWSKRYKDARAQAQTLEKQMADAEAGILKSDQSANPDDPIVATFLQSDGEAINSKWIVDKLTAEYSKLTGDKPTNDKLARANRPTYVVVLEPAPLSSAPITPSGTASSSSTSATPSTPATPAPPPVGGSSTSTTSPPATTSAAGATTTASGGH